MTSKTCVVCGAVGPKERCPQHQLPKKGPNGWARKNPERQKGYDAEWQNLSRRARARQPFCSDCGATEDLQCDHSPEAWRRKAQGKPLRLRDVDVVCGSCNRLRGQARGEGGDLHQVSSSALGVHPLLQTGSKREAQERPRPQTERSGWAFGPAAFSEATGDPKEVQGDPKKAKRRRALCF